MIVNGLNECALSDSHDSHHSQLLLGVTDNLDTSHGIILSIGVCLNESPVLMIDSSDSMISVSFRNCQILLRQSDFAASFLLTFLPTSVPCQVA